MNQSPESVNAGDLLDATILRAAALHEGAELHGLFAVECVGPDGKVKWREAIVNVVTNEGGQKLLDCGLRNQTPITTWYVGLISSVSWTAVAATDTAAQINGTNQWKEAGLANAPTYTGNRVTGTFAAASGKSIALSSAASFAISGAGTIKGCFLVSTNTKDGTTGTLYSAGTFSGDKTVGNGDTVNVSYTATC